MFFFSHANASRRELFFVKERERVREIEECANALRMLCPGRFILAESVVTKNISTLLGDRFLEDKNSDSFSKNYSRVREKKIIEQFSKPHFFTEFENRGLFPLLCSREE